MPDGRWVVPESLHINKRISFQISSRSNKLYHLFHEFWLDLPWYSFLFVPKPRVYIYEYSCSTPIALIRKQKNSVELMICSTYPFSLTLCRDLRENSTKTFCIQSWVLCNVAIRPEAPYSKGKESVTSETLWSWPSGVAQFPKCWEQTSRLYVWREGGGTEDPLESLHSPIIFP